MKQIVKEKIIMKSEVFDYLNKTIYIDGRYVKAIDNNVIIDNLLILGGIQWVLFTKFGNRLTKIERFEYTCKWIRFIRRK